MLAGAALLLPLAAGCSTTIDAIPAPQREVVDRRYIEYPTGLDLTVVADNFTAASALAIGPEGMIYVADHGSRGDRIRITRIDPVTGATAQVYPENETPLDRLLPDDNGLYGPVGGMVVEGGELFVSARDEHDQGIVVAFDLAKWVPHERAAAPRRTVVGELPAEGDHGVTDVALHPLSGRLFFGVGSATNSGVVGVDNWESGWLQEHPLFHDLPHKDLKIFGYRFDTEDPQAGFLNPDKVNTAPFNPFRQSNQRIPAVDSGKPTAALYSVDPRGGDLRVEAHGLRNPAGLAFNRFANLYVTNQGMELRGTRPVKDDPDVVLRVPLAAGFGPVVGGAPATWFGWPDFSTDLLPITMERYQPPAGLLGRTGYRELSPLIDPEASDLEVADRASLLAAVLPSLSGAAGATFVPEGTPGFERFTDMLIVALRGDRAPFATSGLPLKHPVGRKFVVVDPDRHTVGDFVYDTAEPDEAPDGVGLDRPVDVEFAPDGSLYLLDAGQMRLKNGNERFRKGTGTLYRLAPIGDPPGTQPTTDETVSDAEED